MALLVNLSLAISKEKWFKSGDYLIIQFKSGVATLFWNSALKLIKHRQMIWIIQSQCFNLLWNFYDISPVSLNLCQWLRNELKKWFILKTKFSANCVKENGRYYQGQANVTQSGIACQDWFTKEPHDQTTPKDIFPEMSGSKNFCRNPGGTESSPWCYTMDPLIRWQYCDIPKCGKT